jgi:malate synthase
VPLYNLMEDAATAEISRSQVWQWIRHGAKLVDATTVTRARAHKILREEMAELGKSAPQGNRYRDAAALFAAVIDAERFVEFLTLPAYEQLVREGA